MAVGFESAPPELAVHNYVAYHAVTQAWDDCMVNAVHVYNTTIRTYVPGETAHTERKPTRGLI